MNLKELIEKRNANMEKLKALINKAKTEKRTLNEEEGKSFSELETEIRNLDETIKAFQTTRELEKDPEDLSGKKEKHKTVEEREYSDFDAYLRGIKERSDTNMTAGDNGAIIPTSIAQKIIQKVVDMCPIYHDAERYNVKGTLQIPFYDETTGDIVVGYADEFTDGESSSGKFGSIALTGFLARAITDVSKSLINNSQFDIVSFVVNRMARNIALFLEKELLKGTSDKVEGLSKVSQTVTTASATAITADEIIDLQEMIPDMYQANAYFIMNKSTRTAVRKLKDGEGNYLLNKDANSRWGYTLFGKDVYTSENMDAIGSEKTVMYYGDMTGLAVKVSEDINIEILREVKARQHAIEVLGFVEFDAKVQDAQKLAKMVCKKA